MTSRSISLSFSPNFNFAPTEDGISRKQIGVLFLVLYLNKAKTGMDLLFVRRSLRNIDHLWLAAFTSDNVFPSKTKDLEHLGVGV